MAQTTIEEVFYVRVSLSGPSDQIGRAVRYAKENVRGSLDSLHPQLGVSTSAAVYVQGPLTPQDHLVKRDVFTGTGDSEEPPLRLTVVEIDDF